MKQVPFSPFVPEQMGQVVGEMLNCKGVSAYVIKSPDLGQISLDF